MSVPRVVRCVAVLVSRETMIFDESIACVGRGETRIASNRGWGGEAEMLPGNAGTGGQYSEFGGDLVLSEGRGLALTGGGFGVVVVRGGGMGGRCFEAGFIVSKTRTGERGMGGKGGLWAALCSRTCLTLMTCSCSSASSKDDSSSSSVG